jgi:hypothetical protein
MATSPAVSSARAPTRCPRRDSADELSKLADRHDRGVITDAEFQKGKI